MPAAQRGTPDFGDDKDRDENKPGGENHPDNKPDDKTDDKKDPTFAEERMTNADLAARIRDLENTLAATRAGMPLTLVPEHGAGPGMEVAETWSAYEQQQAKENSESGVGPDHPTGIPQRR